MGVWFASDVHLDDDHADLAAAFVDFVRERVTGADKFFVLGDLFESWVGDDDRDDSKDAVTAALAQLCGGGTSCYFTSGNRDFLVGKKFALASGVTLLPEQWVGEFYGGRVLLLHGDTLCTDDTDYQAFRRIVRTPSWQQNFLSLPLAERRAMARAARDASREGMTQKPASIMDVNQAAVCAALDAHDVCHMLHGHTHRPATHEFTHAGQACVRHVLGDWYDHRASVMYWDEDGPRTMELGFA